MLFGQDIGAIGGVLVLDAFKKDYHLDGLSDKARANLSANIVSTLQAGCLVGSLAAYWVSDKWGRKPALLVASMMAIVGVIMQSAGMGRLAVMYIGRFVAGLGVGAASMLTPLYVSENAPRAIRGGLTGIYQLFIATGTMLAFWVSFSGLGRVTELTLRIDQLRKCPTLPWNHDIYRPSGYADASGRLLVRRHLHVQ
jgi:MFS family permease